MSRAAERRSRAFGITRSYGNIRNWSNAMWRQEEASNPGEMARLRASQGGGSFGRSMRGT